MSYLAQSGGGGSAQGWITITLFLIGYIVYKIPGKFWKSIWNKSGIPKKFENWIKEDPKPSVEKRVKEDGPKIKVSLDKSSVPVRDDIPSDLAGYVVESKTEDPSEETEQPPFEDYSVPDDTPKDDPMRFLNPEEWDRMCRSRKLGGLKFIRREETPFGIDVYVKFGGALTFPHVQNNINQLRTGLNLPQEWRIQVKRGETDAYGTVRIITKDPLKDGLTWEQPSEPVRLSDLLKLSRTAYGDDIFVSLKRRIGVFGTSGSGKSCVQRLLGAHVIQAIDADLDVWDLKFGVESQHFEGKATRITNVQEAIDRTKWLLETEYPRRAKIMKENRTSTWDETPDNRALVIMIDEGNRVVRDFSTAQLKDLSTAIETGRALGVYFIWATQFPKSENLPTEIRSQFDCRISLLLMNAEESRIVYKEGVDEGWAPHLLIGPGWMLVKDTENTDPIESKALWLSSDRLRTVPLSGVSSVPAPGTGDRGPAETAGDRTVPQDIWEALALSPVPMGVSDLSRATGRAKSAVHAALKKMEDSGDVCRTEESGRPQWYLPLADDDLTQ